MKKIIICFLAVFSMLFAHGQNMVINPGFETFDSDEDGIPGPDDWYLYSIEYAAWGWHNCPVTQQGENSCDIIHPESLGISGTPRTGVGCAGFAAVANGRNEYFYGTTLDLTSGTEYSVSFWIRKANLTGPEQPWIGAAIGTYPAEIQWVPFTTSLQPNVLVTDIDETYKEVKFCWTAASSGTHYISFGALAGYGGQNNVYYFIDDVSVEAIGSGASLPIASATIPQTTYCTGDVIDVDGSSSQNEIGYTWEIYELVGGSEDFVYSTGYQTGQAGVFNVNSILGAWVNPGECYRVYLKVDGLCPAETFVDFCYTDPGVDFVYNGDPVCEGDLVNLQVTGENGWTYTWYEGNLATGPAFYSGTGNPFQTASVTPTLGNSTYTVVVTTPEGCTSTQSFMFEVHSQNNVAPWMNGVNGNGTYTYYINTENTSINSFYSTIFNDNSGEALTYSVTQNTLPSGSYVDVVLPADGTSGGNATFSFITGSFFGGLPTTVPPGVYYIEVTIEDHNACNSLTSSIWFEIIVICHYCEICTYYEDRTPSNNPLPIETKVGDCIFAGFNEIVSTGENYVLFQAGKTIELGPFFDAGPGYIGIISPTTCVTDCEACCDDFEGFTIDLPIANIFFPNEGIYTTWQANDFDNPNCAYNAENFSLYIYNNWGGLVHKQFGIGDGCCSYTSDNTSGYPQSSIYWDGNDYYTGLQVTLDAYYFYILVLEGCGSVETYSGFTYAASALNLNEPDPENIRKNENFSLSGNDSYGLYPNPTDDQFSISGLDDQDWQAKLFNTKGENVIHVTLTRENNTVDVSALPSGEYFLLLNSVERTFFEKIVVK